MNTEENMTSVHASVAELLAVDCDCEVSALASLDEDGLPNGIPGGPQDAPGETVSVTGTLGYSFGSNGPADSGAFRWDPPVFPNLLPAVNRCAIWCPLVVRPLPRVPRMARPCCISS